MFKHSIFFFLLSSFLIHTFLVSGIYFTPKKTKKIQKKEIIEVAYVNSTTKKNLQIVDQNKKAINNETPEKEAYLGKYNQRVKKQTKARHIGKFINSNNGNPLANNKSQKPQRRHKKKTLKDLMPKFNLEKLAENANSPKQPQNVPKSAPGRKGHLSQTDDHLKGVDYGIETVLNSREFLYYAYYSRIKDKIRQHWGPTIRSKIQKLLQGGRTIASNQDRITKIIIVLNNHGTLVGVKVLGKSGISDLDDAAVEAFKAAAPFPNPPKGMVGNDGTVKIHWDFILEAQNKKEFMDEQGRFARRSF
ncbi:MAG: TonB family protein [Bdellovibrionaceae bacterium]|jgi:TonB family protein|nr:TonB family protein [Pseudobdellovibrionaceae bacterium]